MSVILKYCYMYYDHVVAILSAVYSAKITNTQQCLYTMLQIS